MLTKLLTICSVIVTAVFCDRKCGNDICQNDDDYCYKIYPGNQHSCFGYIGNRYTSTCGHNINGNCSFVHRQMSSMTEPLRLDEKIEGFSRIRLKMWMRLANLHKRSVSSMRGGGHNNLEGADLNMCCCKDEDCINANNYDPKTNWLQQYCKKCSASNQWDDDTKQYTETKFNNQCAMDEPKDQPRWCFDLLIPERKTLDENGKVVTLPSYHELNCEYKLQDDSHDVHYLNVKESHCDQLHAKDRTCSDITVMLKESSGITNIQSPAILCCCDANKKGEDCNRRLKTYEKSECKKKCYSKKSEECPDITLPESSATVTQDGTKAEIRCNGKKIGSFKCENKDWVEDCGDDDNCFNFLAAETKNFYKAVRKELNFHEAETECSNRCSRLAKIQSQSENSFAVGLAAEHAIKKRPDNFSHYMTNSGDRFWFGLKRLAGGSKTQPKLQWLDGRRLDIDKSYWLVTEKGQEPNCDSCLDDCNCDDCVALYDFGPNKWNDLPCDTKAGAICQIEVNY